VHLLIELKKSLPWSDRNSYYLAHTARCILIEKYFTRQIRILHYIKLYLWCEIRKSRHGSAGNIYERRNSSSMNTEALKQIIQQGEGIQVEFKKASFALPKNVFESVCALLNRLGGHLFSRR